MCDKSAGDATLVLAVHGTKSPFGQQSYQDLLGLILAARPGIRASLAHLDNAEPALPAVLDAVNGSAVVVPGLLCTGYHVTHDLPALIEPYPNVILARHLGPDDLVINAVWDRLREAGVNAPIEIALIGSGSSDPAALGELKLAAVQLGTVSGARVTVGTLSEVDPLAGLNPQASVASYLLAEGYFTGRLRNLCGGRLMSAPIGAHPRIADLILRRYDEALSLTG